MGRETVAAVGVRCPGTLPALTRSSDGKPTIIYVTDMSHLLVAADPLRRAALPKEFLRLAHYLGAIVEAGSAGLDWDPPGVPTPTAVRCRKRPRRKPCAGVVVTTIIDLPDELSWHCDQCLAERGVIRNWRTSPWNLSAIEFEALNSEGAQWAHIELNGAEYRALDKILIYDREAERVLRAARCVGEDEFLLGAPWHWMDHFVGFIATESNHARGRKAAVLGSVCGRLEEALRK
jgi:hypothetical protein